MIKIFLVGAGGFVGSVLRYLFSGYVQQWTQSAGFPFGTMTVNLVGCLVIGFLSQLADSRGVFTDETRALVFIGVLGGFTTFSSFANESMNLFRGSQNLSAIANVGIQVILGLGAVWLGRAIAYWIWR